VSAGWATAPDALAAERPSVAGAPGGTPWRVAAEQLRRNRAALVALGAVGALALIALLAPALAPYDPTAQLDIVALKGQPPSLAHPFGTDAFSRDVLSRVLYGARVSLGVAVLAVVLSATLGTAYGAVAGFYGGRVDAVMMRLIDALLAVPRILLLIGVLALWGRIRLPLLILLLGLTGWFGVSRLVRAEVRALRGQDFVTSARALGAGDLRLLLRHLLPNALAPVIVAATLGVGHVVIVEAGLSYLGMGVQQPQPSWGNIIQEGGDQVATMWWMSLFPGLLIVVTVMAFTALGDALRDASDPRQLDGH
jgi:peptide/nickel transport system permease protein